MTGCERITLERMKYGINQYITRDLMLDVKAETWLNPRIDGMCLALRAYALAETLQETTKIITVTASIQVPAGPWQMFKQRYLPAWFRQRFPVREETICQSAQKEVTFTRHATYPKLPLAWPKASESLTIIKENIIEGDSENMKGEVE